MNQLERIEHELATRSLEHRDFERCAQDLLIEIYPGLSPIPGGTDWGRDADIPSGEEPPIRLLVTTSRDLKAIRANLLSGLRSMTEHNVAFDRVVLANSGQLSELNRQSLAESARAEGARVEAVYDRTFFASRLRRDGDWRARLLGLSPDPISLSSLPTDLAESPWAKLPLVGREADLQLVSEMESDQLLTGPPGVGKTRILAELNGAVFVDKDAALGQVADDLRWMQPRVVIVDDAHGSVALIRELVRLRQVEPDLARYRIVAVCWPDEVEEIQDWLTDADVHELGLVERQDLDQLLLSMGTTGQLARNEILDQAEGRPGWAVSLADTLMRARDSQSLLRGRALLGEVQRYLRRTNLGVETIDVLALLAALGGVKEEEIDRVAEHLGVARPTVVSLVNRAARTGLVDVQPRLDPGSDTSTRHFAVRPPMLARVLVAERAFAGPLPGIDFVRLAATWPDRLGNLAEACIDSVLLGVAGVRNRAESLFEQALSSDELSGQRKVGLAKKFARIDRHAGEQVLEIARSNLDDLNPDEEHVALRAEPLADIAHLLARWHRLEGAVSLLLDASLLDLRPTNQYPGHPMRKLEDLATGFHPELPPPYEQRTLLSKVAAEWLAADESDARWRVYRHALRAVLSLHMRSTNMAPGDPRQIVLIETVVDPSEVRRIYEELWPPIKERLQSAPPGVIGAAIESAHDWLRIGGGFDQPFGRAHPQLSIEAAKEFGERLLRELAGLTEGNPGLVMSLTSVANRFDIDLGLSVDRENEIFLRDLDLAEDWRGEIERLKSDIEQVIGEWPKDDPSEVARRLVEIRRSIELSGLRWPDRISMACEALATHVEEPLEWADTMFEFGLFPEGAPFLTKAIGGGARLGDERLGRLLEDRRGRWAAIASVLTSERPDPHDEEAVVRTLRPSDYGVMQQLTFQAELSEVRKRQLLTQAPEPARAAMAAAVFYRGKAEGEDWTPGAVEHEWLDAVVLLDPNSTHGFSDYAAGELAEYLAGRYPEALARWVRSRLVGAGEDGFYGALPHAVWERLHMLGHEAKDELWRSLATTPFSRWLLGQKLVGDDVMWLGHAIEKNLLAPEDALSTYNALGIHMSIEDLARLLVPRGIEPSKVAYLAQSGTWSGEPSSRYAALVEQFERMAASDDESVATVGRAGVELFSAARDDASKEERTKRIRGEL